MTEVETDNITENTAETDKLNSLYTLCDEMSKPNADFKKLEAEFASMIESVKSQNTKESVLASKLVGRFIKHFPSLANGALQSIIELSKSIEFDVRKHAIMAIVSICKDYSDFVDQGVDTLIQLYQTDQQLEINMINASLVTLLNLSASKFFISFFARLEDGSELVRERALQLLSTRIQTLNPEILTKEVEEQIMDLSKKAMEDVTKDEFIHFVGILSKLKLAKTVRGQAMIVESIKAQADLDKDIDVEDNDAIDRFLMCAVNSIPLLTQYNRSSVYVNYICTKILPRLDVLAKKGTDLQVLQSLAEMSPFIIAEDNPSIINLEICQNLVYGKLLEYLPLHNNNNNNNSESISKSADCESEAVSSSKVDGDNNEEDVKRAKSASEPDFLFTHIEYLLYTLHQLCRLNPEFFNEELQNDSRLKLHHLAVGCSKYMELLSNLLKDVKGSEDLKKEENKLRNVALRTTKNISTMVKDLFKKPPQFKTTILLSCKPLTARPVEPTTKATNNDNNVVGNKNQTVRNNQNPRKKVYNNNNNNYDSSFRQGGQKNKFRHNYQHSANNKRRRY